MNKSFNVKFNDWEKPKWWINFIVSLPLLKSNGFCWKIIDTELRNYDTNRN